MRHRGVGLLAAAAAIACEAGGREQPGDSAPAHPPGALEAAPRELRVACDEVARVFRALAGTEVDQAADSFPGFRGPAKRYGCVVDARGVLTDSVTVPLLTGGVSRALGSRWVADDTLVADGPNGAIYGLRQGDVLCLFRIDWGSREAPGAASGGPSRYTANVGCEILAGRR